ncbi:fibronectin type III domain-containing protein 5-like [Notothenia coriiceps]|uniref:Fibronectin type III domain-containing protein 5-like n=1 Tax=Notothenia coriiceps TaxID=8208 RepID=A0A6I9NUZ9_9TELE|nr:PREDICTED: fibronectin type III domain-containing protein 5-like [Notothenia coriiceps]
MLELQELEVTAGDFARLNLSPVIKLSEAEQRDMTVIPNGSYNLHLKTSFREVAISLSLSGTINHSILRDTLLTLSVFVFSPDEVTMEEVGQDAQLRAGELIIIVVVLIMWAGVIVLFCRQYDIIKDNEPNNNKDKAKNSSECSTPEHPRGGILRSNV